MRLLDDQRGNSAVEFAFVAPVFLMMIFLVLDGGRMLFTRQALGELATAAARCAALHPSPCATASQVQSWTIARGQSRSRLPAAGMVVTVTSPTTCNGASGMAKVAVKMPYAKSRMNLLPQAVVPATLSATGCFPVAN